MYQWQTITMARVERLASDHSIFTRNSVKVVKEILYQIGLPHFPTPEVDLSFNKDENSAIQLIWSVDERQLLITITIVNSDRNIEFTTWDNGFQVSSGGIDLKSEQVESLSYWILFGFEKPMQQLVG